MLTMFSFYLPILQDEIIVVKLLLELLRAYLQGGSHDDQEVRQREVFQILQELMRQLLPEEHNVRLDHTFAGGAAGNFPAHHVRLMEAGR